MSLCNHPYLVDCPTTTVSTTTPLTTTNTLPTTTTTTTTTTSTTTSTSTTTTTTVQRCLWNDEVRENKYVFLFLLYEILNFILSGLQYITAMVM